MSAPSRLAPRPLAASAVPRARPGGAAPRLASPSGPDIEPSGARCACGGGCPRCSGPGLPLEGGVRRRMEAGFGADLSPVRVHTDPAAGAAARARGAAAFTAGSHIYFGLGRYVPGTREGERLIAHELAHVLQQRAGAAGRDRRSRYRAGERESRAAADTVLAGGRARVGERTAGLVQRQDEAAPAMRWFPELTLRLDPEVESMTLRHYLRWWIGTSLVEGEPPADAAEAEEGTAPEAGEPGEAAPPPAGPLLDEMPLPPDFFSPLPPDALYVPPDMGAILAPYNLRTVPLGERDVDAAAAIYQRNYAFVSLLPDLRDAAPDFVRPLIPTDWRRSMAGAFTAATLNAQLRHDFPTAIEMSDLTWRELTGASTTYIPLPGFSF